MTHTRDWLDSVTGSASMRSVADRIGEYNVTFTRRINAGDAHTIAAVAREYGVSPIPGLIAAGILAEEDLSAYRHETGLDAYTDLELAQEMVDRIAARQDSPLATVTEFPAGGKATLGDSSAFTPERSRNGSGVADDDDDDGTVRDFDWEPGTYAADSTIDEGKAREERGEDPID